MCETHSRIFYEHNSSLKTSSCLPNTLSESFLSRGCRHLGDSRCNISWDWWIATRGGGNACKFNVKIRTCLSAYKSLLHFAQQSWNSLWQGEWEILFSPKHFFWQIPEASKCDQWSTEPLSEKKLSPPGIARALPYISFIPKISFVSKSAECAGQRQFKGLIFERWPPGKKVNF